jgi:hypothetical protein
MPRRRNDSNPLEAKRRQLEQQERQLAQRRRELKAQLESGGVPEVAAAARMDEPPVWRMEDDPAERDAEPARYRHLARQRRRDMVIFFACIALLLVVIGVLLWIICLHLAAPGGNS